MTAEHGYRRLVSPAMTWRDHARAIAALLAGADPAPVSWSLRRLIGTEPRQMVAELLRSIRDRSRTTDGAGLRRDIPEGDAQIEAVATRWREALLVDLAKRAGSAPPPDVAAALEAQVALLVDSVIAAHNLSALERNIDRLVPPQGFARLGMEQRRQHVRSMVAELVKRHFIPREQLRRMIELRHQTDTEGVTLPVVADLYRMTWRTFGVGQDRPAVLKLTALILANRLMHNASPLLWTQVFDGHSFNAEYMVALGGIDLVDAHMTKVETELSNALMIDIRQRIHALAAQALFVRDLGLSDQYGSGELFDIIWKGEDAYNGIVRSMLLDGVPTLLSIPIVLGGLTVLHPMLGALGLVSIPVIYRLARDMGPRLQLAREQGQEKKRALFTRGNTMIEGIETLLGQAHLGGARRSFLDLLRDVDQIDKGVLDRLAGLHLKQRYPVALTAILSALVGAWLVKHGLIAPGGVISTAEYATRLRSTVVDMIHRYYEQFPREINDARALQRLIDWSRDAAGEEKAKVTASALPSTRLVCDRLTYKSIVRGLSLSIEPGEFVTISGTSGIGKTTLLRLIGGLYRPNEGGVSIGGVQLSGIAAEGPDSLHTLFAISSQSPFIFDGMTLRQNLALFEPDASLLDRSGEVLEAVGLGKLVPDLDRPEKRRLSGGERVRFGLARALLKIRPGKPLIMLLDEPTASLAEDEGPGSSGAIRALIAKIHREHSQVSIVAVTHDRALTAVADRDISLSPAVVVHVPQPPVQAGEQEFVALPGIIVDYGRG